MTSSSQKPKKGTNDSTVATNRRARHDYHIEATYEAGISLLGSEVKSLRDGKASLQDGYAAIKGSELLLHGVHIPEYTKASYLNHEPTRPRKLLLHRHEIAKLQIKTAQQGYTLVPLKLYFKGNRAKVEIGLAKGKQTHDKRAAFAEREAKRHVDREVANRRRG
jgi:SsrA-binding protein